MATLSEDDVYRMSTQYRHWSFTPEKLQSLRATANRTAAERLRHARATFDSKQEQADADSDNFSAIDCLTPSEELQLLSHYIALLMRTSDHFHFPTAVKATAVQYLKRFYLRNSLMIHHPLPLLRTALFMATKTENHTIPLDTFVHDLPSYAFDATSSTSITAPATRPTRDDILAPEFILTQALRFMFDVRHPHRGLRGGMLELLAVARAADTTSPPLSTMLTLPPATSSSSSTSASSIISADPSSTVQALENRCGAAYNEARDVLAGAAISSDVYLLFTPAQIWFAAMFIADAPLAGALLDVKAGRGGADLLRIRRVVRECAEALRMEMNRAEDENAAEDDEEDEDKDEESAVVAELEAKLSRCRDPERRGLGQAQAQKRNGAEAEVDVAAEAKRAKKRKLEREKLHADGDVFGGPLGGAG